MAITSSISRHNIIIRLPPTGRRCGQPPSSRADESADADFAGTGPHVRPGRSRASTGAGLHHASTGIELHRAGTGSRLHRPTPAGCIAPAPQGSGLMNQMLTEQSAGNCATGCIAGP